MEALDSDVPVVQQRVFAVDHVQSRRRVLQHCRPRAILTARLRQRHDLTGADFSVHFPLYDLRVASRPGQRRLLEVFVGGNVHKLRRPS